MDQSKAEIVQNPLATEPVGKLIFKYSIPAIISSLVGSIYKIVDQIFIPTSGYWMDIESSSPRENCPLYHSTKIQGVGGESDNLY